MMKVAIIGSRSLGEKCACVLPQYVPVGCSELISGGAQGVDQWVEQYAREQNLRVTVLRPEYDKFGKRATLIRNEKIVKTADFILCFWDGVSKGTRHVIVTCVAQKKPFRVIHL